jgi:hypothetical protein
MSLYRSSLIVAICLLVLSIHSQTVSISPDINIKNDFSYFVLVHPNGTTSLLRDKSFKLSYQTLYPDFEWSNEKSIELPGKKWRIIEAYENGNDIGIFFISKPDNEYTINYSIYNSQGVLLSEKELYSGVSLSHNEEVKLQASEDKNWINMVFHDGNNEKHVLLYNRKQDSVYYTVNLDKLLTDENIMVREFELSNAGDLYLLGRYNDPNLGKKKQQLYIGKIDRSGNNSATQLITFENIAFTNGYARYNNQSNNIIIGGLYSEKLHGVAKGYAVNYLDKDLKLLFSSHIPFTQELLDEWNGKNKKSVLASSELSTRSIAHTNNGGCLVFYENTKELSRRPYFSSADPTGAYPSRWFDYYFDDIIVAAFDKDGKLIWDRVLHKRQYSQDDEGLFSSFFVFHTSALLGIIFNDAISSEGTVSEYLLKPNGDHIRKSILNTSYKNLNLRFQDARELDAQTVLVPSENNGKLNLVKIVFD